MPFTAEDCFVLGNIAYVNGDYYHTIIWMKQALETVMELNDRTISRATLLDYLSFSYYKVGLSFLCVISHIIDHAEKNYVENICDRQILCEICAYLRQSNDRTI